ncbi:MAG: Holliday junction branch migration protein RuvA [Ignavibacteriales bacterium]|nr:Holliday junction branch migration protein RuvA [Ignavibacteriales bacterium]
MIAHITGTLQRTSPTAVVIDVQGVGYNVLIPLSTFETLGASGSSVTLLTHLHVREDAMMLFGFATDAERIMFRLLLSISGIGPKIALGILSGIQSADLQRYIVQGNAAALTAIPGVGRKTAERLVLELRDKIGKNEISATGVDRQAGTSDIRNEALSAMISLGFSRATGESAIRSALAELSGKQYTIQELLKLALRSASRKDV